MAPGFASNYKGAYLLSMFTRITGTTGINGTSGAKWMRGVCVVNGGVEKALCEVDEELGECEVVICG